MSGHQEEQKLGKAYDGVLMRRLSRYLLPYKTAVAGAVVFLIANALLQIAGPWLTKLAVDRYLAPAPHSVPEWLAGWLSQQPYEGLTQISLLYLGVMILSLCFSFLQGYMMQWTGQKAMFDLRRGLMEHLQQADVAYYDRTPVGRLLTRVTTDVDALNELFASGVVAILGDICVIVFLLTAMLRMSPELTLLLLAVTPLVLLVTMRFRRDVRDSNRRIRSAIARINAFLQEHVTGVSVVQLFNRERRAAHDFDTHNREHMDAFKEAIVAYGWFYPVVEFLGMLALAGLLSFGGYRIREDELTLGALIAFFQYAMRFFRPIQDLSEKYNILQTAMAAAERVFQLLDAKPAVVAPAQAASLPAGPLTVEFDHVWFAYKGEDWVLRDVSFRMEAGETVAVVGHTGAGKTTLTNLLLRFYDIQKGAIRVGGVDIRTLDPHALRRLFGIVLQDSFLFTGTLASNIRLGTETITAQQLREAAGRVNLLEFVDSLDRGFEHEVRERGAGLSTGQKQLISFARALAHNPRFLILDEATSSVDTETEQQIRDALANLIEGRTSIVIAHRLSTVQRANRIFVMHKGQLRESGSHQQLLAQRGLYWRLYQLQYKDQELGRRAPAAEEARRP
ncbi:MAG: ABC transporter ATP-binding protein [Bryobacterales bacterium]|nr:ABC transporter ATP-binding protein [Bryobacterales bacterium]